MAKAHACSKTDQFLGHSKQGHAPQNPLRKPEGASLKPTIAPSLPRVDIATEIENAGNKPYACDSGSSIGPLKTGH